MDDIFESERFKAWEKKYKEEREIRCPFCRELQDNDDGQYPVTYHGEPETTEMECQHCAMKFFVKECVSRTYEVSDDEEKL